MWRSISLLVAMLALGCVAPAPQSLPVRLDTVDIICWSNGSPAEGAEAWLHESKKRFPNPLILAGHGGVKNGAWVTGTTAEAWRGEISPMAMALHAALPNRQIVVVACNPGGVALHVPGVWYCRRNVWSRPTNGDWQWSKDDMHLHCYAGNIWDFEEGK